MNQSKKQHPLLICDEAHLFSHETLEQFPLLLNFNMDSSHSLDLAFVGQPLLRRTLSLQLHEALRQRIAVHYHLNHVELHLWSYRAVANQRVWQAHPQLVALRKP